VWSCMAWPSLSHTVTHSPGRIYTSQHPPGASNERFGGVVRGVSTLVIHSVAILSAAMFITSAIEYSSTVFDVSSTCPFTHDEHHDPPPTIPPPEAAPNFRPQIPAASLEPPLQGGLPP
jgi:hypothetical protein